MDRRDVAVVGVVALVTAASWSAAIAYDAGQREVQSYAEGQRWAQRTQATPAECEAEMYRITGPEIIGGSWLQGCRTHPAP